MESFQSSDYRTKCWNSALTLLSYRMRSRGEITERLVRKGYCRDEIDITITRLKELSLINDREYAEAWVRSYPNKSKRVLLHDLHAKGVSEEDISFIDLGDDQQKADSLAQKKMRVLGTEDIDSKKKMYTYLQRRGFDHDTIIKTVRSLFPMIDET